MPERDYVTEPLKLSFSGAVDFDTLYKIVRNWCTKIHGYTLFEEKEHKSIRTSKGKDLAFKWVGKRVITDYIMYVIEINLNIDNVIDVKGKKGMLCQGDFNFVFSGYLFKDYEDTWAKNAVLKFVREAHDKYITGGKMQKYEKELLKDIEDLRTEVKAFLNIRKTA